MPVLLISEWFIPVILLNIGISIECSLCVSFSVCVHPFLLSTAHYHHLPLLLPFFLLPSSNFHPGLSKETIGIVFPQCLLEVAFPLWSRLARRSAQTPAGLYRSLVGVELSGGPWTNSFVSVCGFEKSLYHHKTLVYDDNSILLVLTMIFHTFLCSFIWNSCPRSSSITVSK